MMSRARRGADSTPRMPTLHKFFLIMQMNYNKAKESSSCPQMRWYKHGSILS
jgi:hypothetical protein